MLLRTLEYIYFPLQFAGNPDVRNPLLELRDGNFQGRGFFRSQHWRGAKHIHYIMPEKLQQHRNSMLRYKTTPVKPYRPARTILSLIKSGSFVIRLTTWQSNSCIFQTTNSSVTNARRTKKHINVCGWRVFPPSLPYTSRGSSTWNSSTDTSKFHTESFSR